MKNTNFPAGVRPNVTIEIHESDGGIIIKLHASDIVAGSLSIKSGTSNSGEFTVGGAVIGSLQFGIMNDTGDFSDINFVNAYAEVYCSATDSEGKTYGVYCGRFWFVNHKETGNVINCEANDMMQIMDEHQMYELELSYPTTASVIVNKIMAELQKTFPELALSGFGASDDFNIEKDSVNDDMTWRECFSYIAQANGKYVRDHAFSDESPLVDGVITLREEILFDWYDMDNPYDAGVTFSHDLRTEAITITGAKVYPNGSEESQDVGANGYMLVISDNPFITEENLDDISQRINSAVTGISFYPGTFSIKANPAIEAGDVLTVQTDKQTIKTIATTVTYKISLQESIIAEADEYAGDMRVSKKKRAKQAVQKMVQDETNKTISNMANDPNSPMWDAVDNGISGQLNDPDSELSQAIAGGGGGDVIQWRGGGWNVDKSEITPSSAYIALLSTVDAIMIDKVDSVYIDGFCIPINKALLESGDIVVASTLAGMHIVSHNQYSQGTTVRNYTNRSYGVAKLSITLSEYNVNGAGTVKVDVQIEQFYGSTKDVVQGFNLSTQQRGSVMFGVVPLKSMMVYGTFTYTESGSMSFDVIETLEKAGS